MGAKNDLNAKAGRYGGTHAHKDIAFNFGILLSPTFQLYVVKEYQQLKEEQSNPLLQNWDVKRILAKAEDQLKVLNEQNAEYRFKKLTSGTEIIE